MRTLEQVLVVLAVALSIWQAWIFVQAAAMLANPNYRNVRYGVVPGIIALVLALIVVII